MGPKVVWGTDRSGSGYERCQLGEGCQAGGLDVRFFFSEEIVSMIRFKKFLPAVVLLAGATMLGAPTQARATFEVEVSVNGGAFQAATISVIAGQTFYGFTDAGFFSVSGTLSANQLPTGALLGLSSTTNVTFTGNVAGSIEVVVTNTGYTLPTTTPLLLTSGTSGGTLATTSGTSVTLNAAYQGVLDSTNPNVPFGNGGGTPLTPGASPLAAQSTPTISGSGTTSTSTGVPFTPPASNNVVASAVPFTMTDILTLSTPTGSANGESFTISASTVATPVPAPAGLVLALTGLPGLCIGAWFRRRRLAV